MLPDTSMAIACLKKLGIKKGGIPPEEPIGSTVMKETVNVKCRCKMKVCTCLNDKIINGPPLLHPYAPGTADLPTRIAWQAIMYNTEFFTQRWPADTNIKTTNETAHIVSSSDQIIREDLATATRRRKKRDPLISPPVSTSSPTPNNNNNNNNNNKAPGKVRKYVCPRCQRSFDYKHVLQNHERTHTGEKPFKCATCDKKFTRDHHLKTHMRLHTGEKPYKCEHCDKLFVQVANLRRHIRVHTGERPYECSTCSLKFSDSNQLKAHSQIHTNEKPFSCKKCSQRYRRKHHLNQHKCKSADNELLIKKECEVVVIDKIEDDDSKGTLSDETVSNDSCTSLGYGVQNNGYHQPWIGQPAVVPDVIEPYTAITIPVQTEPEDLSINKKYRSTNNNNSSGSAGDSSRSPSPLEEILSP